MTFDTPQVAQGKHYTKRVYHTRDCCRIRGDTRDITPPEYDRLNECKECRQEYDNSVDRAVECPLCSQTVKSLPHHLPCEVES